MATQNDSAERITQWLAEEWGRCFASAIESMADQKPATTCDGVVRPWAPAEGAVNSEQEFSLGPACVVRLSVPEMVWREVGTRVLKAAGIDEVSSEDALSTYQEVLSQTFSGLAQAFSGRLGHEVTCSPRSEKDSLPDGVKGLSVAINLPDAEFGDHPVFISPAPELVEHLRETASDGTPAAIPSSQESVEHPAGQGPSSISKTFDLLLGVHLPVSVSFGKTTMMVKEVLKLTTGSIVELNRAVTEPVDIIVNNCVIARGEVVVVSGNYGVRVREIISREQRYQTGIKPAVMTR